MKKYLPFLMTLFTVACSNNSDPIADKSNFNRIYDNDRFNTSYYPIDVTQTPDGPILMDNNAYYFFSMTSVGLQSQLIAMDADGQIQQTVQVGGTYPAAAAGDNGNFLLLSYDNVKKESVVSIVSPAGTVTASGGYTIGEGDAVEAPIINHFIRNGRQYPFQVGKAPSGKYFFNGFYNYTFSLVFTDLTEIKPNAVQGQQDQGGLNQVVSLTGDTYATSRFSFGDNYLLPNATLSGTSLTSSVDLGGNSFPELVANAPVKILLTTINSKDIILYASNTRSRQIALYAYEKATGKFLGSKYLGFSNPYEIASLVSTKDRGLAVCGTTYVAGRFPRICLFKLSESELTRSFVK